MEAILCATTQHMVGYSRAKVNQARVSGVEQTHLQLNALITFCVGCIEVYTRRKWQDVCGTQVTNQKAWLRVKFLIIYTVNRQKI